jgi:hypothetical protein
MPDLTVTVDDVHPIELLERDLLLTDPDDAERKVRWRITAGAYTEPGGVIVAEYVTEDDGEPRSGRHGFEDPMAELTVQRVVEVPDRVDGHDPLVTEIYYGITREPRPVGEEVPA